MADANLICWTHFIDCPANDVIKKAVMRSVIGETSNAVIGGIEDAIQSELETISQGSGDTDITKKG